MADMQEDDDNIIIAASCWTIKSQQLLEQVMQTRQRRHSCWIRGSLLQPLTNLLTYFKFLQRECGIKLNLKAGDEEAF